MAFTLQLGSIVLSLRPNETHTIDGGENLYSNLNWTDGATKPTEQELIDHEIVLAKTERIAKVKMEARKLILDAVPQWKQNNLSRGVYSNPETTTLNNTIDTIRTDSDTAETDISALGTVAAVESFTW